MMKCRYFIFIFVVSFVSEALGVHKDILEKNISEERFINCVRPLVSSFGNINVSSFAEMVDSESITKAFAKANHLIKTANSVRRNRQDTPLHGNNDINAVMALAARGADVNAQDRFGQTPIMTVTHPGVREFLLEVGSDIRIRDAYGNTLLHKVSDIDFAKDLIAKGADVNARNDDGQTPLQKAIKAGNIGLVRIFIAKGADVNARDRFGRISLHEALDYMKLMDNYNNAELLVWTLIDAGANVNAEDHIGRTPLDIAQNELMVLEPVQQVLLKNRIKNLIRKMEAIASISTTNNNGRIPLHKVFADIVIALMESMQNVLQSDGNQDPVMKRHIAESQMLEDFTMYLIEEAFVAEVGIVDVNLPSDSLQQALSGVAKNLVFSIRSDTTLIEGTPLGSVLESLADVSTTFLARDGLGDVGMMRVESAQRTLLINNGNGQSHTENTYRIFVDIVKKGLMEESIDVQNDYGGIALHKVESANEARDLIAQGADIHAQDSNGNTPLHLASNADIARVFIEAGADVNERNRFGKTPIYMAKNADVVRALVEAGANVNVEGGSFGSGRRGLLSRIMTLMLIEDIEARISG